MKVVCSSTNIPKTLELDITGMEIGQRLFLRDIQVGACRGAVGVEDEVKEGKFNN